jgi:hypothetical protein
MARLIFRSVDEWIKLPDVDGTNGEMINLSQVKLAVFAYAPPRVTLHYSRTEQKFFIGLQAIALMDRLNQLAGIEPDTDN